MVGNRIVNHIWPKANLVYAIFPKRRRGDLVNLMGRQVDFITNLAAQTESLLSSFSIRLGGDEFHQPALALGGGPAHLAGVLLGVYTVGSRNIPDMQEFQ